MKCEKVRELISEYMDGELSPEKNRKIKEHLEHCAGCSILANTLRATVLLSHEIEDWELFPRSVFNNLHNILEKEWQFFVSHKIEISDAGETHTMPANIIEQADASGNWLVLIIELAGVKKENIQIRVGTNSIEITGSPDSGFQEKQEETYYLNEIKYGEFRREIELPCTIVPEKTKSSFKNGLLKVKMLKA